MRNRLPVYIENKELPVDRYKNIEYNNIEEEKNSYGYVSIMYLCSLIITIISLLSVMFMWNR